MTLSRWLVGLAAAMTVAADEVPGGFRGDGTGAYPGAHPPLAWSLTEGVAWRVATPRWSNASPVVRNGRVLICAEPSTILCYSLADGTLLWQAEQDYADIVPDPETAEAARVARSALVELEARLQSAERTLREANGELRKAPEDEAAQQVVARAQQALDVARSAVEPYAEFRYPRHHGTAGLTSPTPASDGERFYVLFASGTLGAYTMDGRRVWGRDVGRPRDQHGHSASPVLADGRLIVHVGGQLLVLEAATGETRWTASSASGWGTPAVARADGRTLVLTPAGDWFDLHEGTKLADRVQPFQWNGPVVVDGVSYQMDERGASAVAIEPDGTPRPLWTAEVPRNRYYATSLMHDGLLYNVHQGGRLTVLDAGDGSLVYQQDLPFGRGRKTVYPSPLYAEGRIYFSAENGTTVVVKAGREYQELAVNQVDSFRTTPVPVGRQLLIRTVNELLCLE